MSEDEKECLAGIIRDAFAAGRCEPLLFASERDADDFRDTVRNDCHGNAKRWVEGHNAGGVEQGWIIQGTGSYASHSVVRQADGSILDVTLTRAEIEPFKRNFVAHHGVSDALFDPKVAFVRLPIYELSRLMTEG